MFDVCGPSYKIMDTVTDKLTPTDISELRLRSSRHSPSSTVEAFQRARVSQLRLIQSKELMILHSYSPQALRQLR